MLGPIRDPIPSLDRASGAFVVLSGESYAHTVGMWPPCVITGRGGAEAGGRALLGEFSGKYSEITVVGVGQAFSRGDNLLVGGAGACVRMISASKAKALL